MSWKNARTLRAFGISIPILSTLFFWFLDSHMNLWETSITPGFLLGGLNILLAYWIYKNLI
jgi:hypothetical protein